MPDNQPDRPTQPDTEPETRAPSESQEEELTHEFFSDESEEPTIVWVRPPRRLRGFTRRVHFLVGDRESEDQS